jgi:hypothetical protein
MPGQINSTLCYLVVSAAAAAAAASGPVDATFKAIDSLVQVRV